MVFCPVFDGVADARPDPLVFSFEIWHQLAVHCTSQGMCNFQALEPYFSFYYFYMNFDATDLRLLDTLQTDASLSNQDLAERALTSPATALRRVRRLVDAGVIERRVALLNPHAVGEGLTALVEITLDRQGAEHLGAFEARAVADAAVQQCWRVSPGPDFVLVLQVPHMAGYQALVQRLFTQDANVRNVKAFFSVKRAKFDPRLALPAPAA
jgi:Lrp/AsnC family transcriptional regulator, leucine-responsive regulatory protein